MKLVYNDGGRALAGFKGQARDCVCRSIAIATGLSYKQVYDDLNRLAKKERWVKGGSSSRDGVHRVTYDKYLKLLGWKWHPCMGVGTGCKVHLHEGELPMGRLIVKVSRHMTCVVDGVIHDTLDPQRHGVICEDGVSRPWRRCVYGYYYKEEKQ